VGAVRAPLLGTTDGGTSSHLGQTDMRARSTDQPLAQYRRCVDTLRRQLDTVPSR